MSALLLLRAVPAASLLAVADALGVQRAADDLVAHAREVLHTAAAHEHHRVLLQVVADARDVGGHLDATGEADASDLAQRRVRLLRRRRVDAGAHPAALRGTLERRGLGLLDLVLAALADQLVDRGHGLPGSPTCAGSCSRLVLNDVVLCWSYSWCRSCSEPGRLRPWATVRPPRSGGSPFPGPADEGRTGLRRPSRLGAAHPLASCTALTGRQDPGNRKVTQAHREREQAQGTLGTADHDTRAPEAGQSRVPHMHGQPPRSGRAVEPTLPAGGGDPTQERTGGGACRIRLHPLTYRQFRHPRPADSVPGGANGGAATPEECTCGSVSRTVTAVGS